MACSVNFSKKSIIFITGASKGIGKAIAIELSRRLNLNSIFVLIARSQPDLDECKRQISEVDKNLTVLTFVVDLSKPDLDNFNDLFKQVLTSVDTTGIEFGILFHNAGHVGTLKQTTDLNDLEAWRNYFDLNLFSAVLLNNAFIGNIRPIAPQLVIVNITSLCGRAPFVNLGMYGSGKAARDLFFKVLATEEPNIVVLNYSPGPVQTEMFESIVVEAQSEDVRRQFGETKKNVLQPEETVNRMLEIMEKGSFKSGDTVDYFDSV